MTNEPSVPTAGDRLVDTSTVVLIAATLLSARDEELSRHQREQILGVLARRAGALAARVRELDQGITRLPAPAGDEDRVHDLEVAERISRDQIEALEAAAVDSEAAALVSDARILALASEVDRLLAARDHATVIDEAKGVLMRLMKISDAAVLAVLGAASQRDNVAIYTVASRLAAEDQPSAT